MDSNFTPDGSMLATLFRDSSIYFWNLNTFEADLKISTTEKELQLTCFDFSRNMHHIVAAGKTSFIVKWDISNYFGSGHILREVFKLPEGFHSVKKIKYLPDSLWFVVLSEGQFFVLKRNENELEIDFSIKLPLRAIMDFDIDFNCYYVILVSSEGDVSLYDIDKAKISDEEITWSWMRLSSWETVSHHRRLLKLSEEQL